MSEREIVTLGDLIEAARSTEDVDGLMDDLRVWVDMGVALNLVTNHVEFIPKFIWNDDGERGLKGIRIDIPVGGDE